MPAAAVIIRSFNERALIGRCLESVLAQDFPDGLEVVVVDSGSTDGTLEIVRSFASVRLVTLAPSEFTYGRALNFGVRQAAAGASWLAFLSAHAVPQSSTWLRNLVAPMRGSAAVAGVYGRQVPWPEHLANRIVRHLARNGYRECYGEQSFVSRESPYFSNANAAIRRAVWESHSFDETMPYAEDWKWSREIRQSGHAIAYAADAAVWHSHAESARRFLRRRRDEERGKIALEPATKARLRWWHYGRHLIRVVTQNTRRFRQGRLSGSAWVDALCTEGLIATAVYLERRRPLSGVGR